MRRAVAAAGFGNGGTPIHYGFVLRGFVKRKVGAACPVRKLCPVAMDTSPWGLSNLMGHTVTSDRR